MSLVAPRRPLGGAAAAGDDRLTSQMWTPKPAIELSSQRAVRRHNLSIVLRQVVERGPRSRATIAQHTGLNKSTVSSLVSELMDFGLLVERGAEHRGTAGRPGLVVDVARDGVVALGLEINVDYLGVQATDLAGGSRYKAMEAVDNRGRGVEEVFDALGALTQGALNEVQAQGLRPIGATVARARAWSTSSAARCWSRRTCTGPTCR